MLYFYCAANGGNNLQNGVKEFSEWNEWIRRDQQGWALDTCGLRFRRGVLGQRVVGDLQQIDRDRIKRITLVQRDAPRQDLPPASAPQ